MSFFLTSFIIPFFFSYTCCLDFHHQSLFSLIPSLLFLFLCLAFVRKYSFDFNCTYLPFLLGKISISTFSHQLCLLTHITFSPFIQLSSFPIFPLSSRLPRHPPDKLMYGPLVSLVSVMLIISHFPSL